MSGSRRTKEKSRFLLYVAAAVLAAIILGASLVLMNDIEQKLRQGAEHQVVTFTQQAAENTSYRVSVMQKAIGSFTVQSSNSQEIVPALKNMCDRFGFLRVAFAAPDGHGLSNTGDSFSITDLPLEETAVSQGVVSFSDSYQSMGQRVRLAQSPKYINGELAGALYVEIPLSLFAMPRDLNMFNGRGYFFLFQGATGEILTEPADETKTPLEEGMSFYAFLDEASKGDTADQIDSMKRTVAAGKQGLFKLNIDGKNSYVAVSSVGMGSWYVCNVIPVENVRAEAAIVLATFQVVFGVVLICLLVVGVLLFSSYRKRLRARSVSMKSHLYKAMSDSLDMAVNLYCPADGSIIPIVAKSASILGYSLPEIMNERRIANKLALSKEGHKLFDDLRAGTLSGLVMGEFSFKPLRMGKTQWISYSVSQLMYEEKQRYLVVMRDTTKEKELQFSMKDAMTAAEAANQAKSEFLSRMSHEIRTPMNAIIGMLQIAKLHTDDPVRVEQSLKKIGAASNHLLNLINDVLDISKIESGKMVLTSAPFRLSTLISNVVEVIKSQCEQKNHVFEVEEPENDQIFVGDVVRLRQMLINLLSNSVKYTPDRGTIRFSVTVSEDSIATYQRITFAVADNGIGMTQEFKERLFEPFVMEGRSNAQGTGLGMPIVKNAITMMGGNISVDTAVDEGTTFTVDVNLRLALEAEVQELLASEQADAAWEGTLDMSGRPSEQGYSQSAEVACKGIFDTAKRVAPFPNLPNAAAALPEGVAAGIVAWSATPPATSQPPVSFKGLRVLLAEDNDLNAEIACELLGEVGIDVDWSENGKVAYQRFQEAPEEYYDFIFMDVQMPLMDGHEATRRIRALDRPDATSTPIIAMSANAFSEDVRASLESGMDTHLSKPIDMRRVLETLEGFLRKSCRVPQEPDMPDAPDTLGTLDTPDDPGTLDDPVYPDAK